MFTHQQQVRKAKYAQKQRYENMKISRPETMSGKIRHLENICENISLRNRGKVFPTKV